MRNGKERPIRSDNKADRKLMLLVPLLLLAAGFLPPVLAKKKILCLHGGGGTGEGFAKFPAMRDLEGALPDFEFVYADGGYTAVEDGKEGGHLWIPDPPGGKKEPTTDPAISDASIAVLDDLRASAGPFAGILGYSQGAAYVSVYLSRVPENTFDFALSFCGYPTETHLGILNVVEEKSTFGDVASLVWIGANDFVISPDLTRKTIDFYESPLVVESEQGGHIVPGSNDPTFEQVVSFIKSEGGDGDGTRAASDDSNPPSSADGTNSMAFRFVYLLCFVPVFLS